MLHLDLDAKREEFRKYLEKEGVLKHLTTHLVPLYEKAGKPTSALEYLKNNFAGKEVQDAKEKAETLESGYKDLKNIVDRLEKEKDTLASKVSKLEKELEDARKNVIETVEQKEADPEKAPMQAAETEDGPMETEENEASKETTS